MKNRRLAARLSSAVMAVIFAFVFAVPAAADSIMLRAGRDVHLVFDSPLSSKTARPGDRIWFHVQDPVTADGRIIVATGTRVGATVDKVTKRYRYGVNATVQVQMDPLRAVTGKRIPLRPKTRGRIVGSRTGGAAAATVGGALLLGPVGLVGGLFIVGKQVNAHPGDRATVEIARDTAIRVH